MIYVVMMKEFATEIVTPIATFDCLKEARMWVNNVDRLDEACGFKIEAVQHNPTELAY